MSKPIKIMKKFRVGYSVKWNFNGILEVEAENADDAEKKTTSSTMSRTSRRSSTALTSSMPRR